MQRLETSGVKLEAIVSALPTRFEDNLVRCRELYGDAVKAENVVKATGIRSRRIADEPVSSLDLCVAAAERLFSRTAIDKAAIGAVLFVSFTPERMMPGNAFQAQKRLGLGNDIVALDLNLACSGWVYGLYLAALLVHQTRCKVLLLDGDVQSRSLAPDDAATVPVLADAGTATLIGPSTDASAWRFAFFANGEGGEALTLPVGGKIAMDGFAVFRFVATEVTKFLKAFLAADGAQPEAFDAFVPHQANVYMISQLAKSLGFTADKLKISADEVGNSASATIPVTISRTVAGGGADARLLVAGFGGGLSAAVGDIRLAKDCVLESMDFVGK